MQWKKPADQKYTDLCIYIDAHIADIATPGAHPDIENTVYNYLWLVVKALAIKKRMFSDFQDYDGYAFYSANRLFYAIRNNYNNTGKTIKGKVIKPIKSCLNYTKALLYPMKLEYQKETFNTILSEEYTSKKFDAFMYSETLKAHAQDCQPNIAENFVRDTIETFPCILENVLAKSPFQKDSLDYNRLKMSILLNCARDLGVKNTLDWDPTTIMLWKLPKSISSYVRVLLIEFYTELKKEIIDSLSAGKLDDSVLAKLVANPEGEFNDYEDKYQN